MISNDDAKRQLGRIAHLPGFPREEEGVKDLIAAMRAAAPDLAAGKQILTDYLADPRRDMGNTPMAPTPQEIRMMGKPGATDTSKPVGHQPICPLCNGDGFVPAPPAFLREARYERVQRCSCDRQASFEDRAAAGQYRPEVRG